MMGADVALRITTDDMRPARYTSLSCVQCFFVPHSSFSLLIPYVALPLSIQEHAPRRQAAWKAYCVDRTKVCAGDNMASFCNSACCYVDLMHTILAEPSPESTLPQHFCNLRRRTPVQAEAAQSRLAAAIAAYQHADFPEDDDELGMLDLRKGTWAVEVIPQGVSAVLAAAPTMTCAVRSS